jgi:hypothetical protein
VRFTKVLTKYSTEYNNSVFIQGLCQLFGLDEKDLFSFFLDMRINHENDLYAMMETYEISKLDINRIYRYIDKYTIDNSNDDGDDGNGNEEDVYVNEEVYGND